MKINDLFEDMEKHLLEDEKPSEFFNRCTENPVFKEEPFLMLYRLTQTKQSPQYHPEGNVWNHTMMVLDEAAKVKSESSDPRAFMWAALLHDIGKPDTTRVRKGRITSYNHEQLGEKLTEKFLFCFSIEDKKFVSKVKALVRWHMQILFSEKKLPYGNLKVMKEQVDSRDIALLTLCDRLGRGNADPEREKEAVNKYYAKISR